MNILKTFSIIVATWVATATYGMAAAAVEATAPELTPEQRLSRLPLLYRQDAQAFYAAINPLLNAEAPETVPNPYEVYMKATLWGQVFGVMDAELINPSGLNAVDQLVTTAELRGTKRYWLTGLGLDAPVEGRSEVLAAPDATPLRRAFESHFGEALRGLVGQQNIFAYYVKGLLEYNGDLNSTGAYYLHRAADGFCKPALNMLNAIYQSNRKSTAAIEKKLGFLRGVMAPANQDVRVSIEYAISHSIFEEELTPRVGVGCCRSALRVEDESATTDYARKFAESILATDRFNSRFYENARDYLVTKVGDARRGARFGVRSRLWVTTGIITPLITMAGAAFQMYYTSHLTPPTGDTVGDYSYAMARNGGAVAGAGAALTLGVNLYQYIRTPRFSHLSDHEVDREATLSALWCAATAGATDTPRAMADGIFDAWFEDVRGCAGVLGCSPTLTLSQIALNRR